MRIIAVAMIVSVGMYVAIAWFLSIQPEAGPPPVGPPPLRLPLAVAGIVVSLAAVGYRFALFTDERIESRLRGPIDLTRAALDPKTLKTDPALLESLQTMSEAEQRTISFLAWYVTPYILQLALGESVVLLGLVLAMVSKNPFEMLPFAVISVFLIIRAAMHPGLVLNQVKSILNRMRLRG